MRDYSSTTDTRNHPNISKLQSSALYPPQSSPVKNNQHVASRKQVQLSPSVKETPGDEDFTTKHLSPIPSVIDWEVSVDRKLLATATKRRPEGGEWQYYHPFASLLTTISRYIFNQLPSRAEATKVIEFVPNGNKHMIHHPGGMNTHSEFAPDVIGVTGPLDMYQQPEKKKAVGASSSATEPSYWSIPYQMVRTAIEMKDEKTDGLHQAISYVPFIFEASPHISGMYVLAARPQYYQLAWVDATGATASLHFSWTNLEPLAQYLYSLYVPPSRHYFLDPTLEFVSSTGDERDLFKKRKIDEVEPPVEWNVTVGDRKYERCALKVWQYGQGRRTTLFQHTSAEGEKTMIKDAYRDEGRRFKEKDLVKQIHREGTVPGVVRILDAVDVKAGPLDSDPLLTTAGGMTAAANIVHRTKTRLVMGSSGDRLQKAKTVGDLVKAIYDVVEVHRMLVLERKVLHRDMSRNNILMYPQHHSSTEPSSSTDSGFYTPERPLRFIDEVLQKPKSDSTAAHQDCARCLLIDFDNACPALSKTETNELPEAGVSQRGISTSDTAEISQELAERTGTARFIARSVAYGQTLPARIPYNCFDRMPVLRGKAKQLYIRAYGKQTYTEFCDKKNTFHGRAAPKDVSKTSIPFTHRPSHDVESIYWTLLLSLIAALPSGEPLEELVIGDRVMEAAVFLYGHTIKNQAGGTFVDPRSVILSWPAYAFEDAMHPKLQGIGIGKLLERLTQQVRPEYAFLDPAPPMDHLHEAFRRILLEFIVEHGEDCNIELNTEHERNIAGAGSNDKKRQREDVVDISSNKRSKHGEVIGSRFQSDSRQLQPAVEVSAKTR